MQIWYSPEIERNDFSSKIFFSTLAIPRAIHNGITAINADIYTEYYRAIGSCEKGLDKRIDAQSRYRAKGGRGGGREREKRTKKRYESGDFLREYNTGVGQRRVIIIGGNNAINLDNERSRQSFRQVSERSPT